MSDRGDNIHDLVVTRVKDDLNIVDIPLMGTKRLACRLVITNQYLSKQSLNLWVNRRYLERKNDVKKNKLFQEFIHWQY